MMSAVSYSEMIELIDNLSVAKIVSMEVRPLFILAEQSFAGLRDEGVPENILTNPNLQGLKDQQFDGREAFRSALASALGAEALEQTFGERDLTTLFFRHAKQRPSSRTSHYLDIIAEVLNTNDRDLKLIDGNFEFFIHDIEAVNELISIGTDTVYQEQEMYLPSNPESEAGKATLVKFSIDLGSDQSTVFDTLAHLLNFSGRRPAEELYMYIEGTFDLGIKSKKGWTYGEAVKVRWMFCPTVQDSLPLSECYPE